MFVCVCVCVCAHARACVCGYKLSNGAPSCLQCTEECEVRSIFLWSCCLKPSSQSRFTQNTKTVLCHLLAEYQYCRLAGKITQFKVIKGGGGGGIFIFFPWVQVKTMWKSWPKNMIYERISGDKWFQSLTSDCGGQFSIFLRVNSKSLT